MPRSAIFPLPSLRFASQPLTRSLVALPSPFLVRSKTPTPNSTKMAHLVRFASRGMAQQWRPVTAAVWGNQVIYSRLRT